jgi:predicted phosphodiesterase
MSILIVSDLHIGDHKSKHLRLYKFLESRPDITSVIIAGDLFDLWVARAGRAFQQGKYLLDYLYSRFDGRIIYLTGNHDEDLQYVTSLHGIPIRQFYHFNHAGKSIVVCHGHQYDNNFYLNNASVMAKANAWIANRADNWFKTDLRKLLVSLSDHVKIDVMGKILFSYELMLKKEFSGVYDIVITGHTHVPCVKVFNNLIYINAGDFLQNSTAVLITDERVELLAIDDAGSQVINSHLFKPT